MSVLVYVFVIIMRRGEERCSQLPRQRACLGRIHSNKSSKGKTTRLTIQYTTVENEKMQQRLKLEKQERSWTK